MRQLDDPGRDRRVHRVEIVTGVVEEIERFEHDALAGEVVDGGMTRSAHVAHRDSFEGGARGRQQQIDSGRTEPDHDDARLAHPDGTGATVVVVVVVGPAHVSPASRHTRGFAGVGGITVNPVLPLASGALFPQVP